MGQLDNLPQDIGSPPNSGTPEDILRALTQDVQRLQHTLTTQLSQDIERLQSQKRRLMDDIEALEGDYADLQQQHQQLQLAQTQTLTQQQQAQQQLWAKRLAQALATHLQARLQENLTLPSNGYPNSPELTASLSEANQRVISLDTALHSTLQALQQDLNSYQSSLSQQISRMHSMEHQGEAILEALVNRLSQALQVQMARPLASPPVYTNGHGVVQLPPQPRPAPAMAAPGVMAQPETVGNPVAPSQVDPNGHSHGTTVTPTPTPAPASGRPAHVKTGMVLVVLSTLALSIHNVLVGIIGYGGQIFGHFPVSGIFPLTIPNSLMLLWLRMVVVLPLLTLLAAQLYPRVWRDIQGLFHSADRRPLYQVMASGGFLFLSQVLIYKAISDIGPGVAVTLLFMYPLITVPLAWFLFGDRPSPLRLVVMFAISMGIVFTALPRINADLDGGAVSAWGVGAALLSSVAFALFLVSMQLCFRRLHPVPVSLLQFSTIFVLTSFILIVGSFFGLEPSQPTSQWGLYLGGLMLGVLTLLGYLFNNYGVQMMGAAQASIIASSGPVITAILAYLITPGEKSSLQFIQWMGVILVTLGVISLSFERLAHQQMVKKQQASR